ncbi:hypothetical protein KC362_g65 [Hortaea werneckii]|nr:hypothetical protein KC362_g65 [Hortaea werneckii]
MILSSLTAGLYSYVPVNVRCMSTHRMQDFTSGARAWKQASKQASLCALAVSLNLPPAYPMSKTPALRIPSARRRETVLYKEMADCGFLPLPVCIQCGTKSVPYQDSRTNARLHCRRIICWPAALLCCCCATDAGKRKNCLTCVVKNVRDSRRYIRSHKQCDTLLATTLSRRFVPEYPYAKLRRSNAARNEIRFLFQRKKRITMRFGQ